jgi:alkylhydroperoxidase family enzyme
MAHGSVLLEHGLVDEATLSAIVGDHRSAPGLSEVDVAVMDLADKVAADATTVTQGDVDRLRGLGLTDADVTDVVLAAAARAFFSKTLDALGAEADAKYAALDPALRETLTVGRPIAEA